MLMVIFDVLLIAFCFSLLEILLNEKFRKTERQQELAKKFMKMYHEMFTKMISQEPSSLENLKELYKSFLDFYIKEIVFNVLPFLFGFLLVKYYLGASEITVYPGLMIKSIHPEIFYILCFIGFILLFGSLIGSTNMVIPNAKTWIKDEK